MGYVRLLRVNRWNYPELNQKTEDVLRAVVGRHAMRIAADIRKSFKAPKSGRVYYYQGRRIQASAPGEPPAIRSGRLYANVDPVFSDSGMQARINPQGQGVFYAAWLETGTSRMEARPYITPAFNRRREAFLTEVRTELAKALRKG